MKPNNLGDTLHQIRKTLAIDKEWMARLLDGTGIDYKHYMGMESRRFIPNERNLKAIIEIFQQRARNFGYDITEYITLTEEFRRMKQL